MSSNIIVRDAAGALITMKTIERDGVHTPYQIVGSVDKKFRDSFPGTVLDSDKWESVLGTGGTASVASGTLVMGSGTTANSESYVLSKEVFTVPFRLSFNLAMSQRIANQSFFVEMVSVDDETLNPDGKHCAGFLFDGTSVTQAKYRVQNSGITPLDSAASTVVTTAAPGGVYEVEPFADECWFHSNTMDSTSARANSYRRHQQIPDPNALYKVRLRWLNGSTAPASSTNATLQFVAVQDYQELTAEITAGRGQSTAGQAIAVAVATMPTVVSSLTPSTSYGASGLHHSVAAATTNATSVKTSAAYVNDITLSNTSASPRYFKLYNKASAPTVGTDTPVRAVMIPPNSTISLGLGTYGIRLSTGLAYAVTAGMANNDTTAIGANEVIVGISYA